MKFILRDADDILEISRRKDIEQGGVTGESMFLGRRTHILFVWSFPIIPNAVIIMEIIFIVNPHN